MKGVQCEVRSLSFDDLEVKVKQESDGFHMRGFASIFNTKDFYRDIIRPKAYKKTIKERKGRIKVLWQHDEPAGVPTTMEEQEKGLYTESLLPFTQENKERMEYVNAGVVDGLSVGFIPEEVKYIEDEDDPEGEDDFFFWPVREILKTMLLEYSLVTIPGHDDARLVGTQKAFAIQQVLQKGGRSDLAHMVTGANLKDVSADLIEEMLGYLGAIYKSRTGTDYVMPSLTPDQLRSAALTWKSTGGLYVPDEKASVTVNVEVGDDDPPAPVETPKPEVEEETQTPQDEGETSEPEGWEVEERDLDNLMNALNDLDVVPPGKRTEEKDLQELMEMLERIGG